ncbi:MAG: RHS repeat-associated core domain-containing protein [Proteobacteria bacterium]|nr:RHS repeat-associated core domain-containing protein [Pseudomonadota bacterium]MBU4471997.1 RHS repeat-associated core domain-containing protein [Pseudomonadota bacterium]
MQDATLYGASKTDGSQITLYDYSSRGELLSATLPDTTQIEYIHDPMGRRTAKKVNGNLVEKYLWQGMTTLLAVYDGSDNLLMRFRYADDRMPVAMEKAGVVYYLAYDQVGSLRLVADGAGNVVKRIDFDSFGNIIADTNPALAMPFGFAGGLHDKDTGLVRFGYRDYDPDTGRWTAKDPILFEGGDTDLYGYVLNNPVNLVDPEGLFVNLGAAGVGAAIGGAVGAVNALFNNGNVLQGAMYGAGVGGLAGLSFGTSLIANSAIGAAIGVGTDYLMQRRSNPCQNIDTTSLVISGLSGALGGGAGAAALKGGASAINAALVGGSLSGGVSMGLNYITSPGPNMVPYNPK